MVKINKTHTQNTQRKMTLESVSYYGNKWYPPFSKQPFLFYQPLPFYGENLNSPPFFKNFEISTPPPPFIKGGGTTMTAIALLL